jgi:hypothetical protein
MTSLVRKFGLVVVAALALALVPGSSVSAWGQSKPSPQGSKAATGTTGKTQGKPGATGSTQPSAADVLKKAEQMRTEAGRRAAAQAEQQAADAKAKEAAAKGGKPEQAPKANAIKTSGFIVEKGDPFALPFKPPPTAAAPQDLPQGQAGLLISQADFQGVLKTPSGNVALVRGPHDRSYFLKVNDKIYQARVTNITADSITFEETVVDPLGKTSKRLITKNLPTDAKKP